MSNQEYTLMDELRICEYHYCTESGPTQSFKGGHFGMYRLEENEDPDVFNPDDEPVNTLQVRTQWPLYKEKPIRYATVILDFQGSYSKELPYRGYRSCADLKVSSFIWKTHNDPVERIPDLPYTVYWWSGSKRSITVIVVIGKLTDELEKEILDDNDLYISEYDADRMPRHANVKYFNQDREDKVENLG